MFIGIDTSRCILSLRTKSMSHCDKSMSNVRIFLKNVFTIFNSLICFRKANRGYGNQWQLFFGNVPAIFFLNYTLTKFVAIM